VYCGNDTTTNTTLYMVKLDSGKEGKLSGGELWPVR
jgi:hypothetical protein